MAYILIENCRLCQINPGVFRVTTDVDLTNKIFECTKIKVNDDLMDNMPSNICSDCYGKLGEISEYVEKVTRVDQFLRKALLEYLENNETKPQKVKLDHTYMCKKCSLQFSDLNSCKSHIKTHSTRTKVIISKTKKTVPVKPENPEGPKIELVLKTKLEDEFEDNQELGSVEVKDYSEDPLEDPLKSSSPVSSVLSVKKEKDAAFECEICTKQFNCKSNLRAHIKTHNRNFICPQQDCGLVCPTTYALKIHQYEHGIGRPFLCVKCGKFFKTSNSLICHERIHSEVKAFYCEECNIGFTVRSNLRAHQKKVHEGLKFYCSKCKKPFSNKSNLDRHEKIHTGIKEFKCDECTGAFYTRKELAKHKRYHQGIKLYKCGECFKSFYESHHLTIHSRIHTGERPYSCDIPGCEKSFVDKQKLKRHKKSKHN